MPLEFQKGRRPSAQRGDLAKLACGQWVPWACRVGTTGFEASQAPGRNRPNPGPLSDALLQTFELEAISNFKKRKFFYYKIIFMVPLARTLWQMHNYSELHFIAYIENSKC